MTYAIVETGGKQLRVEPGRFYDVELLHEDEGAGYSIDKVLLVSDESGVRVGQPYVEGATVEGLILNHFRGKKVIVYKMQPKKKTRKKRGHRQEQTRLLISAINLNGEAIAAADVSEYLAGSEAGELETPLTAAEALALETAEDIPPTTDETEPEAVEETVAADDNEAVEAEAVAAAEPEADEAEPEAVDDNEAVEAETTPTSSDDPAAEEE